MHQHLHHDPDQELRYRLHEHHRQVLPYRLYHDSRAVLHDHRDDDTHRVLHELLHHLGRQEVREHEAVSEHQDGPCAESTRRRRPCPADPAESVLAAPFPHVVESIRR